MGTDRTENARSRFESVGFACYMPHGCVSEDNYLPQKYLSHFGSSKMGQGAHLV